MFGRLCYPYLRPYNSYKLQSRSSHCTFLGYTLKHKHYKCLSSSGKIYIFRHVTFDESRFPFKETNSSFSSSSYSAQNPFHLTPSHYAYPSPLSSPLLIHLLLSHHLSFPQPILLLLEQLLSMSPIVPTWSLQLIVIPQLPHYLLKRQILILWLQEPKMEFLSLKFSYRTSLLLNPVIFKRHSFMKYRGLLSMTNIMLLFKIILGLLFLYLPIDMMLVVNGCLSLNDTMMALFLE